MAKYISKKTVPVDAVQYTGDPQVVVDFINDDRVIVHQDRLTLRFRPHGGVFHVLELNNYLVKEPSGFLHPVQKEIFESAYVIIK